MKERIIYLNISENSNNISWVYIKETILPNRYKHFLSLFLDFKAAILKIPGNKFNPNGYIIDITKLIKVSIINIICVFLYTPQKQEIKYQKKIISKKLSKKNKKNLIFIHFSIFLDFSIAFK